MGPYVLSVYLYIMSVYIYIMSAYLYIMSVYLYIMSGCVCDTIIINCVKRFQEHKIGLLAIHTGAESFYGENTKNINNIILQAFCIKTDLIKCKVLEFLVREIILRIRKKIF